MKKSSDMFSTDELEMIKKGRRYLLLAAGLYILPLSAVLMNTIGSASAIVLDILVLFIYLKSINYLKSGLSMTVLYHRYLIGIGMSIIMGIFMIVFYNFFDMKLPYVGATAMPAYDFVLLALFSILRILLFYNFVKLVFISSKILRKNGFKGGFLGDSERSVTNNV